MEDCQMVEGEAHRIEEEEARPDQSSPGEEATDIKMVDQEEPGDPESSGPRMEADTEDNPPLASSGDTVSPEEEAILLGQTPQPEDLATGSHSPRSETAVVSGGMAGLRLASPACPGTEKGETS